MTKKLFLRIDKQVEGKELGSTMFEKHINYLKGVAKGRKFLGGGFKNKVGGMIAFEAISYEEAIEISKKDPIIDGGFYTFEVIEWDILIDSTNLFRVK